MVAIPKEQNKQIKVTKNFVDDFIEEILLWALRRAAEIEVSKSREIYSLNWNIDLSAKTI